MLEITPEGFCGNQQDAGAHNVHLITYIATETIKGTFITFNLLERHYLYYKLFIDTASATFLLFFFIN